MWQNCIVALPVVALFSGLGLIAVSMLDQQTSLLVGVTLSAFLLPRAVTLGIVWVAFLYFEKGIINLLAPTFVWERFGLCHELSSSEHSLDNCIFQIMFQMKEAIRNYVRNMRVCLLA
jgi:hypothetical protein